MTRMYRPWRRWPPRLLCASLLAPAALVGCHPQCLQPPPVAYPSPPPLVCPAPLTACKPAAAEPAGPQPIDLPTALRLADSQNPEIAVARERIREALAVQERVEVLWLPNLEAGPTWTRHDGQIQRATGEVITVSRSALFVGGAAALTLDTGDALFQPLAARQLTAASQARAAALTNELLLDVALAYIDLLQEYAGLDINEETLRNARRLLDITAEFERTGKGAAADTARARTEALIRERERREIEGRIGVASARLVRLLRLPPEIPLRPVEPALLPLPLIPEEAPLAALVAQALGNRPEMTENRALTQAALERWRAAKISPWLPNLRLAYAAGGFGGGPNSFFGNFDGRQDVTAGAFWQLDNLGLGDMARTRERHSQFAQAEFRQHAVEAEVAQQVVAPFRVAFARRHEMELARLAVEAARDSYHLNEERVRRAPDQGRPIELLQAVQALARTRLDYLQVVADYNRAQFRLYTALGNPPLCALERAAVPTPAH